MDGEGKTEITSIFLVRNQSDSCISCEYIATKSYIISFLSFLDLSFYLKFVSGNCTQFVFVRFFSLCLCPLPDRWISCSETDIFSSTIFQRSIYPPFVRCWPCPKFKNKLRWLSSRDISSYSNDAYKRFWGEMGLEDLVNTCPGALDGVSRGFSSFR